jgi:hypothetical protein
MAEGPAREFGKRRPQPAPTDQPVKRSGHVALLLMGSFAVGGGAYALMPRENCTPVPPGMAAASGPAAQCAPRGSSSGVGHGGSGGSWLRSNFFGGDLSSSRSSGTSSESGSSGVTRGGFGSFASVFSRGG